MMNKEKRKPDVLKVSMWLCFMVVMVLGAGLVYYFGGSEPSDVSRIIMYVLLGLAAAAVLRLAVWGFGWVRNERVSELGLHIVRFAVILTAVVLCVFAMMSADYSSQYRQSAGNELRQQALAARIHLQDLLGQELGTDANYYHTLYDALPSLLDENDVNAERHVNLYLFVTPDRQPEGTPFSAMAEDEGIFAAGTGSRYGVTASAGYIDRVYHNGRLTFSEYIYGQSGFENRFMSAFVPVFTAAGRPVGVLELCQPGMAASSLMGHGTVELLLRIVALIAMFSFGFYGVMQLLDIMLRPRKVDRSCRVLSCGREAARPVLFFVALCAGLPVMLLISSDEMQSLVALEDVPEWLSGVTALLPVCLYLLCFLLGWILVRRNRERLTEAPSNASLVVATLCAIALILLKDTSLFAGVAIMNEWYIPLALIALCGLCYGISYRTISKYQAQSDLLFGNDKYAYLCTALGIMTGVILGGWLLDASGEAGVKVAMLLLNAAACAISIILLEDLDCTVEGTRLSESRVLSVAGLSLALIPMGLACAYVWVYVTSYLGENDYSVTARSIVIAAPVIACCFGNRLRLRTKKAQRTAICLGGVIASLSYITMVWTPAPVMAVASCGLLCLAVVFMSAGVYSALQPDERGGAFRILLAAAMLGALGFGLLSGFFASRLCLLIIGGLSVVLSFVFLGTKFPNRITAPEYHDSIGDGKEVHAPYVPYVPEKCEEPALAPAEQPAEKKPEEEEKPRGGLFGWHKKQDKTEPEKNEPESRTAKDEPAASEPVKDEAAKEEPAPAEEPKPFVLDDIFSWKETPAGQKEQPEEKPDQPEEAKYDWDKLDVHTTDVMSEFLESSFGGADSADDGGAESAPQSASEQPENDILVIFPDDGDDSNGYDPEGGALPRANEKLGSDEGFIDFDY